MSPQQDTLLWAYRLFLGTVPSPLPLLTFDHEVSLIQHVLLTSDFQASDRREFLFGNGPERDAPGFEAKSRALAQDQYATPVTEEDVKWGFKLVLGRPCESEQSLKNHMQCRNRLELVWALAHSKEFRSSHRTSLILSPVPIGEFVEIPFSKLPPNCFVNEVARQMPGTLRYPIVSARASGYSECGADPQP